MDIDRYRHSITVLVGHREDSELIIRGLGTMVIPTDLAYGAAAKLLSVGEPAPEILATIQRVWDACPAHQRELGFCDAINLLCAKISKGLPV